MIDAALMEVALLAIFERTEAARARLHDELYGADAVLFEHPNGTLHLARIKETR